VLRGHAQWLSSAVFSPDGTRVLTSSDDGTARLWDMSDGQLVRELRGHTGAVRNAVFSPTGGEW
jgi:WD40 repeat protein